MQATNEGLLQPCVSGNVKDPYARSAEMLAKSGNQVAGIYRITLGLGYNTDLLAKEKLVAPARWSDLIQPEHTGDIETSNSATSGTAYTILATLVQLMGEDKAFDYVRSLNKNVNRHITTTTLRNMDQVRSGNGSLKNGIVK